MLALRLLSEGGEGPNTELLWVLGILLGFFVLAVVVGWVSSLRKPKQAEEASEAVSSPVKKKAADDSVKMEEVGTKSGRKKKK